MSRLLVVAGPSGAGKTVYSEVASNYGFEKISISECLGVFFDIPLSYQQRKEEILVRTLRHIERFGLNWFEDLILRNAGSDQDICLDGLRIFDVYVEISKYFESSRIVFAYNPGFEYKKLDAFGKEVGQTGDDVFRKDYRHFYLRADLILINDCFFSRASIRKMGDFLAEWNDI